ncbi:hypothetical protein [Micromonospora sp. RP3T]|uniref:hypothetical protein n=1 Tax=Micromonospora sp. RP3T TaxID=2135446 RepID=UPI000D170AEC|nr:hypothetical protein [Micromonospora sp. RP3T]PTA43722.1 hypothetical protein C8054_24180 [Micromonospora sp. RP3T]
MPLSVNHSSRTVGSFGRWLLLATALLQVAAPPLIGFRSQADDPPLVPPGPFFAVWGVILLGCLAVAVWGFPLSRATEPPYRRVQVPLSLVQLGFVAWLVAAASAATWLTVPIFVAMLAGLAVGLRRVLMSTDHRERTSRALVGGVLGVYAGWSTAAVCVNTATLLPESAFVGGPGLALQCAFVVAAATAAGVGAFLLRGQLPYTLTAGWALAGVAVSAVMAGLPLLAVSAVVGLLGVGAVALLRRRGAVGEPRLEH